MNSVYVHVPFCVSKCLYCDFLSFPPPHPRAEYAAALSREIAAKGGGQAAHTVFFGGGTPTTLDSAAMLGAIRAGFAIAEGAEVTIEANPDTLTPDKLARLRGAGFNRLSLGVQSFLDSELAAIGRAHDAQTAKAAFHAARAAGFATINIDLMFALPGQTPGSWGGTLLETLALAPEHISCYALTVSEGAPLTPLGEEEDRALYETARRTLASAGYAQYEISNFAKPGHACKHNLAYWTGGAYIGLGLGAHSYTGDTRYRNTEDLAAYLSGDFSAYDAERLTLDDRMDEFAILGLRLTDGIAEGEFHERFGAGFHAVYGAAIDENMRNGLLERFNGRLRLTERGMDLSNIVFAGFLRRGV
jgi:oxygen-independent coproporphyrinogen-3 oxidase